MISGSRLASSIPVKGPAGARAPVDAGELSSGELSSTVIEDAAIQAALQPDFSMQCYQLSPGRQVARMDRLGLGRQQIVCERQDAAVQKLGATPANLCTISHCTPDPAFRFSDRGASGTDTLFFMPENTEFDLYVPTGARTFYISFDQDAFLRGARALDPPGWERPPRRLTPFCLCEPTVLRQAVDLWLETAHASAARGEALDTDVMRGIVLQSVLGIVTAATAHDGPQPRPPSRARALRICQMSRDFVDARIDAGALPTVVDICASIGVSERALQYAFREYVGMSPVAYLRLCRLNRVRAALLAASPEETTVTQVAMQFGFLHLGRFAGDYKRLFEQAPSATLAS
ncbi:helix-turn-helix domain-containing protein [Ancylobacter pratisalsi]|uniref:Helix-turn-helix domain-containing protein n=1 Tax=Ancylobacter pratisalsi TaxID=1745854 RepID=A0A6P1YKS4_9HYPH|nr:helix-turn-helix domain-containing protein [Ancylobacter pratisalsi]QIB33715.1 helix-turn-helix domain-containing protein [Ancylobacter pratisalsi]